MSTPFIIRLHANDDVVIACQQLLPGTEIKSEALRVRDMVPPGHKVATRDIKAGEPVHRYNQIIGFASGDIEKGRHIHVHNLTMGEFERDYAFCQGKRDPEKVAQPATFQGYVRANGKVGTRNYIGILASVNCSATVVRAIADHFNRGDALKKYPNIDGVLAVNHSLGCGMSAGEGTDILRRTLIGYATQANMAAVLFVGLGCEMNQVAPIVEALGGMEAGALRSINIQDVGGTRAAVKMGIEAIEAMLPIAAKAQRTTVDASHLIVGLNCGGSDGYSGITANPALGGAVDILVAHGGTAILSETPEIYGAEHLLTRRAATPEIAQQIVDRINWWTDYTARNFGEMNNNPSVGNKAGGLTTILEKSLGAVAKGGTTTLKAFYQYAEPVTAKGFVYMDTPGYDPVSGTGQAAGGANLICFTTGRGSAYGCAGVPTIKLATNNALWERQRDDMDINCGNIIDGSETMAQVSQRIFEALLKHASGEKTRSELLGYGFEEFVPWQVGAVM